MLELQKYGEWSPTPIDRKGAFLSDRQGWLVAPVSQTRDSVALCRSNFAVALREFESIDPDGVDHEKHGFNHWGPGWFEIIILRPGSKCANYAMEMLARLEDYPVLDEMHLGDTEFEEACEAWANTCLSERVELCRDGGVSVFAARRNELPTGENGTIIERLVGR